MSAARDLARALDRVAFMRSAGMEPAPWQAELLRSPADRCLLLCARQAGKSTVTAALALHTALYEPGALVLLFSAGFAQSKELLRRVKAFHDGANLEAEADANSVFALEFPNGSRVLSLSAKPASGRGYSARLAVIDEAAFTPDDLYEAVDPTLATGGRMVAMSTPNGQQGWFHREWTSTNDWHRIKVTGEDVTTYRPGWLQRKRRELPDRTFRAEYLVEFVDVDEQLFGTSMVTAALTDHVQPLPAFRW